jgi:hypothetical protein
MKKIIILYPADNLLNESILFPKIFPNLDEFSDYEIQVVGRISEKQFKEHYPIKSRYIDFFEGFGEIERVGEKEIRETEKNTWNEFRIPEILNKKKMGLEPQ